MTTCKQAGDRLRPGVFVMLLLGSFWLHATTAHAIPVRVDTTYLHSTSGNFVNTQAFFDTGSLTGFGVELVQIERFDLRFSQRGFPLQSADIIFPLSDPFPEKTLLAEFNNGVLDRFFSMDRGGNASISVSPPANFLGENILLGKNELIDIPCCAGFTRYLATSRSDLIDLSPPTSGSVSEPATLAIFGLGLIGIGFMKRRRKLN